MRTRASMRGMTRNSMGERPRVFRASSSSFVTMVPSWVAKAAPVRPIMMMAVIIAPISRAMEMPTRSAMNICAPNFSSSMVPTNPEDEAHTMLMRDTMGRACTPHS